MRVPTILALLGTALPCGLAAWAALLIIPACGLDLGRLDRCPPPTERSTELESEIEHQALLTDQLNNLQLQLAMLPDCPPPETPPDPDRLDAEKWQEGDITLLEGCWSLASDYSLQQVDTGAITDVASGEMCFDSHGQGNQELVLTDGATCSNQLPQPFSMTAASGLKITPMSNALILPTSTGVS